MMQKQWVRQERWKCVRIVRVVGSAGRQHLAGNCLHIHIYDGLANYWQGAEIYLCLARQFAFARPVIMHVASFLWPLRNVSDGAALSSLRTGVRMTLYTCAVHMRLLNYIAEAPREQDIVLAPGYLDTWAELVRRSGWHLNVLTVH